MRRICEANVHPMTSTKMNAHSSIRSGALAAMFALTLASLTLAWVGFLVWLGLRIFGRA